MPTFEEYYVDDIEETLKIILTMTLRKISRLNYEVVNPFFVPLKIDSIVDPFFYLFTASQMMLNIRVLLENMTIKASK